MAVLFTIAFVIGVVLGCIFTLVANLRKSVGALRVNYSDPDDGPYIFLELSSNPGALKDKKYVTLKVNIDNYNISQK